MLILFQSFSAVANSLDFHATDLQHLQQQHQHSDDHISGSVNEKSVNKPNDGKNTVVSQHNPADCHHCGHCNGTHLHWVGQNITQSADLALQSHLFHYLRAVIDAPVTPLLRPPKA